MCVNIINRWYGVLFDSTNKVMRWYKDSKFQREVPFDNMIDLPKRVVVSLAGGENTVKIKNKAKCPDSNPTAK
jgi:hypothetical protein